MVKESLFLISLLIVFLVSGWLAQDKPAEADIVLRTIPVEFSVWNTFERIGVVDFWEYVELLSDTIMATDHCRKAFIKETGKDPADIGEWGEYIFEAFPLDWSQQHHTEEYWHETALTTCWPPMVVWNVEDMMKHGMTSAVGTVVHEFAHLATCSDIGIEVSYKQSEKIAQKVEEACMNLSKGG